jgi:hypothetical protein
MEQLGLSAREVVIDRAAGRTGGLQNLGEGRAFNTLGGEEAEGAIHHPGSDSARRLSAALAGPACVFIHKSILVTTIMQPIIVVVGFYVRQHT